MQQFYAWNKLSNQQTVKNRLAESKQDRRKLRKKIFQAEKSYKPNIRVTQKTNTQGLRKIHKRQTKAKHGSHELNTKGSHKT